ncbi:ficolin-1-like [Drosophila montana]|uniref:ficolin-1-like n=1 Tax=Drosophila montana TaxID=40370 RepID=UPI00313B941E
MLLKIICTIFVVQVSMNRCEENNVHNLGKLGNLTIKYGKTAEIHFQIIDPSSKLLQSKIEALQLEQSKQFAELTAKFDKLLLSNLQPAQFPGSCAEAGALSRRSGVYQIVIPAYSVHPFLVSCDEDTQNGGWTVILRREDGSVNFSRYWNEYKHSFGNVNGEFFIGLDKLHAMTKDLNQELLIAMEDFAGQKKFAKYERFAIGSETNFYALSTLGEYSGDAGDSLSGHLGNNFSARDKDNDQYEGNCAEMYTGGWWYNKCHTSNLMGKYNESTYGKGINWLLFSGHNASLKNVQMMIRHIR